MQLVQGYCQKHKMGDGSPMPKVDRNGESVCMFCESELTQKTGITSTVEDPGDEELRRVLAKSGIAVPPSTGKAPMPDVPKPVKQNIPTMAPPTVIVHTGASFEDQVRNALAIMRKLPMPSDVKQFKAIHKVIAGMESLLGEK